MILTDIWSIIRKDAAEYEPAVKGFVQTKKNRRLQGQLYDHGLESMLLILFTS